MNPLILLVVVSQLLPIHRHGVAKWYSPHVMERTYQVRVEQGLVRPGWVGALVEVPECGRIGSIVLFGLNGRSPEFGLVVDCSQTRDYARHIQERLYLEVSHPVAVASGSYSDGHAVADVYEWPLSRELSWRPNRLRKDGTIVLYPGVPWRVIIVLCGVTRRRRRETSGAGARRSESAAKGDDQVNTQPPTDDGAPALTDAPSTRVKIDYNNLTLKVSEAESALMLVRMFAGRLESRAIIGENQDMILKSLALRAGDKYMKVLHAISPDDEEGEDEPESGSTEP